MPVYFKDKISSQDMTQLIVTLDYELYFGKITGTVAGCMIEPTNKIRKVIEEHSGHMTIFWDVLHYFRLKQLADQHKQLLQDSIDIENQLISLLQSGHDVQFHFHPHWYNALYDGNWIINDKYYAPRDIKDSNTLQLLFSGCVNCIENIYHRASRRWEIRVYRAGGWQIQPFSILTDLFNIHNIQIDSSVMPGKERNTPPIVYDFLHCKETTYKFDNDVTISDESGRYIEVPINSVNYSFYDKIRFHLLDLFKYKKGYLVPEIHGTSIDGKNYMAKKRFLKNIIKNTRIPLSIDNQSMFIYNWHKEYTSNTLVFINHPKELNSYKLNKFKKFIGDKNPKLLSFEEYVKEYQVNHI
jgi:hypothetical protein